MAFELDREDVERRGHLLRGSIGMPARPAATDERGPANDVVEVVAVRPAKRESVRRRSNRREAVLTGTALAGAAGSQEPHDPGNAVDRTRAGAQQGDRAAAERETSGGEHRRIEWDVTDLREPRPRSEVA